MFEFETQPPASRADALHLVFQAGEIVSEPLAAASCVFPGDRPAAEGWPVCRQRYLGRWDGRPCFAVEIADADLDPRRYRRGSLYQLLGRVDEALFALAGRAAQLLRWERDHRFCSRCGGATVLDERERAMHCAACSRRVYPRISPCVIVLVTDGDYLLLARNARTRRPFYSTLAGFVEAGETLEHCLCREVREEVGVEVGDLRYFGSQAWPFPDQLMVGFHASYRSGAVVCQPGEIADAGWYHYRDLPPVPPAASIAGRLIQTYIEAIA